MRFIGDIHGNFMQYCGIAQQVGHSVQVGDYGAGFSYPYPEFDENNHRFIRGNHDSPEECRRHPNWINDGRVEETIHSGAIMYVGGARSIDQEWRTEGHNWWPEEELSIAELGRMVDRYIDLKPAVMVTHDCPEAVVHPFFGSLAVSEDTRTRQAFQSMWEAHKPDLWIFGHWHYAVDQKVLGTRFICLDQLTYVDLDL